MRSVFVIGVGAGDPEHVTMQAVRALNAVDVFFVMTKEREQDDLVALRREILDRFVDGPFRVVEVRDPPRARATPDNPNAVADWRSARADIYERLLREELGEDGVGGVLVWGDPALYDSTIGVLDEVAARGDVAFDRHVIAGISSVQALAAGHQIPLHRVAGSVLVTTGRRLARGWPEGVDDVVVMLDPDSVFQTVDGGPEADLDIYWGAYLGTPDELLMSGPLPDVAAEIVAARRAARERKGWMFDTYLLRRSRRA